MTSLRIGTLIYRKAEMTADEAESKAFDVATDISALALFLKHEGLEKDYKNAMEVASLFNTIAPKIGTGKLEKVASLIRHASLRIFAMMTLEQAQETAADLKQNISELADYLKAQKVKTYPEQLAGLANAFGGMVDKLKSYKPKA